MTRLPHSSGCDRGGLLPLKAKFAAQLPSRARLDNRLHPRFRFSLIGPKQILVVDALGAFRALGLEQQLTPQRSNGARAMIERMRADAAAA
jgi:hypothetical protein